MKQKRILVWFKNDLRVEDHEALFKACAKAEFVLPIYIFDDRIFHPHPLGFAKTGSFRTQFLIESVSNLRINLELLGAELHVFRGEPENIIPALVQTLKLSAVYANREVTEEEVIVQQKTENQLSLQGVSLELFWQNTLYHLEDIPWPIQHLPDTFTLFRKEAEHDAPIRKTFPKPERIPYRKEIEVNIIPAIKDFGNSSPIVDERRALHFCGGEDEARRRLKKYFWEKDLLKNYKETRNELIGGDYSSKFSPWLSLGCISPRVIYEEVKRYETERVKNDSTYWLVFELMWRDYFRFAAKKYGNKIFQPNGIRKPKKTLNNNIEVFEKWRIGETGIAFIDANMKELLLTGFMSNRGRQNVASYLVHDLKINWTWGASWFESQLIDYDVASNWLNWAYIAGVGNDPREDRYFNTESQAKKYDSKGIYTALWLDRIAEPSLLSRRI